MKFIVENWFVIVAIAAVGGSIGYAIYSFVKMPSDKQLNKVREWLLYAVTKAEKELGAGTGKRVVSGILRGTGNETGQNHGQTDIFHFVGIGGGDMDRSSVHTGFYIHYVSDR